MTNHELLQQIEDVLSQEKVNCHIVDSSKENPQPRLLVFLGNDYQNRERILEITAKPQFFTGLPNRPEQASKEYVYVQFEVSFPFKVVEEALQDTSSLLLFINRMIDLPGLELDELNNRLFYRYVCLSPRLQEDSFLYISILGLIMMVLDLFTETIEKIASGQATFNQLLEQMIEISNALQKQK